MYCYQLNNLDNQDFTICQVERADLPAAELKKKFPKIAGFHYISCHDYTVSSSLFVDSIKLLNESIINEKAKVSVIL